MPSEESPGRNLDWVGCILGTLVAILTIDDSDRRNMTWVARIVGSLVVVFLPILFGEGCSTAPPGE